MKGKRIRGGRGRKARRRRFILETLEPRVVLDAGMGAEVTQLVTPEAGFEQFESADELQQFLTDAAVERWKDLFGSTFTQWPNTRYFIEGDVSVDLGEPLEMASGGVANRVAESFDGTNIQVKGVDEADLVKTDGEYVYVAGDGLLSIIDARNPAELSLAAEIPLDSYVGELYVRGDRLVLLSNQYSIVSYDLSFAPGPWFPGDEFGPRTSVTIYDITDRTTPILVQETTIDGNLTTSRRIDNLVYLVTSDQLRLPVPAHQCDPIATLDASVLSAAGDSLDDPLVILPPDWPESPTQSCVYETEREYLARVTDGLLERAMPSFETLDVNGEVIASGLISEPAATYKPLDDHTSGVTSIIVIDLSTETSAISAATSLITDSSSLVYASAHSIYVATGSYKGGQSTTNLQKFAIRDDGTGVDLAAFGSVPGWLVNQFSIDEFDGYLRVVTSQDWGPDRTNRLFVLEPLDTNLDVVGSIDEIATGETVFAVRFVGDEAFVVTFRVVDPLFTIDLSDPTHPAIAGELKIPGFSNYLHPISGDFVLGLGRAEGSFRSSPQLSLFDVSDFSLPTRVDEFVFERANWSEAFYNHHAISYFPDSQIAVIPFQGPLVDAPFVDILCAEAIGVSGCRPQRENAFWVVQIDTASDDKSLRLLGTVEHDDALLRSLRIGENLFTVSAGHVKASELRHPETLIDELYFGRIAYPDYATVNSGDREIVLDVLHNDHVEEGATIIEASATAAGAVVEISADGKTLLYTPATNSDAANDSFDYTVKSGDRLGTAVVQVHIKRESVRDHMIRLAKADLIERLGLQDAAHQIQLNSVIEQNWPDSCLGVAQAGEVCAQVITPGFEIVFEYALTAFAYHTDRLQRVVPANDPVIDTGALIQFRAEVVNAAGEPVTSLLVGEQATLQIHADDLRDGARGVFAAYFDVLVDPAPIAQVRSVHFSSDFSHGVSGTISERGLIDEAGGFNSDPDADRTLVVSIPFVADGPGELRFTVEAADETPDHEVLLLGLDSRIPHGRIHYGEAVVEFIESLHNEADPLDANMDGEMTPLDALIIMNHLNRHGAGPVDVRAVQALRAAAAESHTVQFAPDVNRDRFISPIDVLLIVNAFNGHSEALAEGESSISGFPFVTMPPTKPFFSPPLNASRATRGNPAAMPPIARSSIEAAESVPINGLLDDLAKAAAAREDERALFAHEDTFFAELATSVSTDWWRE